MFIDALVYPSGDGFDRHIIFYRL